MAVKLNKYSSTITEQASQGASQAMLYATGLQEKDMKKPQVGIASMWYDGNPCNMHLLDLAKFIKEDLQKQGALGMGFNTIGVSDGIAMGTKGMCYSLPSRDVIADSIEMVMSAQWYDGLIAVPGCDKNMPGAIMAMARLNRPSMMVYGGTIQPGRLHNKNIDIVSAFQSYSQYLSGSITEQERQSIVRHACPGAGACGGMYTANTMACAIEALGMSLPYSSSNAANSEEKIQECKLASRMMLKLLDLDLLPSDIMTRKAFENAIVLVVVMGGSTNAILHLLAMAKSIGVELTLADFQKINDNTPVLADFKPSGKFVMADLSKVGGTPAVMKLLLREGMLHGDCMTVTGKTLAENLNSLQALTDGQEIINNIGNPIKKTGHLRILYGNLAPEGAVAKITGKEGVSFKGPAKVFNSEDAMVKALEEQQIMKGQVVVIRYVGPKGGPGMPEMLKPTSMLVGAGLSQDVAMITDGRFSGGSHGFIIGHISPEAQVGGPIALLQDGDIIEINAESNTITLNVDEFEMARRQSNWVMPPYKISAGVLYKYIQSVSSASSGCITDS